MTSGPTSQPPGAPRLRATAADWTTPRPVEECYWIVPGRLLVGAHPGSRSRAQAMDRLRRFLEAGVTCFVDLTEPEETPPYENLLPFETPAGRRVEYLREPIRDHDVPESRDVMSRVVALVDGSLKSGHVVYLHCRAGIGRSAMAAGCWLVEQRGTGDDALAELNEAWQPAAQSQYWSRVPETEAQVQFVREWSAARDVVAVPTTVAPRAAANVALESRVRGAWYGLALGDAVGYAGAAAVEHGGALRWGQPAALALCLADSLADRDRCDARDQIERYLRWFREGERSPDGRPGEPLATADVAKALATYRWRGLPMAGSHDPRDDSPASLTRVLAVALHAAADPVSAVALAAECSRTTHQSPLILDACRCHAAMIVAALQGRPVDAWLQGLPDTVPSCWDAKPLRKDVRDMTTETATGAASPGPAPRVLHVLGSVRRIAFEARSFEAAIATAVKVHRDDPSTAGALAGTLYGLARGFESIPAALQARLEGRAQLDEAARRHAARLEPAFGVRA